MDYPSVSEALRALLVDSVKTAHTSGLAFAVVGGWSPLLLNSHPIGHPGTRDVDLLFHQGTTVGGLQSVLRRFLESVYIPSAKHPFQLIRLLTVDGERLAFN